MNIKFIEIKINLNFRSSMSWPALTCKTHRTSLSLDLMNFETRWDSPWARSWSLVRIFIGNSFLRQERIHVTSLRNKTKLLPRKQIRFWRTNLRILWTCASKFLRWIVRCQLKKKPSMMTSLKECTTLKIKNWKNNSEDKDVVLWLPCSWLDSWLIHF